MLNREYRILKYIYKHPKITKSALIEKFPDFEEYHTSISEYVFEENENKDDISDVKDSLIVQATNARISVGAVSDYVNENMPDTENVIDDSLIFFSTRKAFKEHLEKRRHDAWLFWFPYIVTTLISIVAAAPTIYKIFKFICSLFVQAAP